MYWLVKFTNETKTGAKYRSNSNIGLVDNKLVYMKFDVKSKGFPFDPYFQKNPLYVKWHELMA